MGISVRLRRPFFGGAPSAGAALPGVGSVTP
jgi:hypothetical protein